MQPGLFGNWVMQALAKYQYYAFYLEKYGLEEKRREIVFLGNFILVKIGKSNFYRHNRICKKINVKTYILIIV